MELYEFKKEYVRQELAITEDFGTIFTFLDFGNINKWFTDDAQDWDNNRIFEDSVIDIELNKLKEFVDLFSGKKRIYYGTDSKNHRSQKFIDVMRIVFGKRNVVTKPVQYIRHYLSSEEEIEKNKYPIKKDDDGEYIFIPKCNFDVEISVDALKMTDHYDTFCIFSGDSDFAYLNNYLRKKGKKVVIFKAGHITRDLRESANLVINAQKIKKHIAYIKTRT